MTKLFRYMKKRNGRNGDEKLYTEDQRRRIEWHPISGWPIEEVFELVDVPEFPSNDSVEGVAEYCRVMADFATADGKELDDPRAFYRPIFENLDKAIREIPPDKRPSLQGFEYSNSFGRYRNAVEVQKRFLVYSEWAYDYGRTYSLPPGALEQNSEAEQYSGYDGRPLPANESTVESEDQVPREFRECGDRQGRILYSTYLKDHPYGFSSKYLTTMYNANGGNLTHRLKVQGQGSKYVYKWSEIQGLLKERYDRDDAQP